MTHARNRGGASGDARRMEYLVHRGIESLVCNDTGSCQHLGLLHERYAPIVADRGDDRGKLRKKQSKNDKQSGRDEPIDLWFKCLEKVEIPSGYAAFVRRWEHSFAGAGHRMFEGQTQGRLLIGHGYPAPTDVGLTLHRTWGVPVLPGSAIKGLLAHFVAAAEGEHADWTGPGYDSEGKRLVTQPGSRYAELFGMPALEGEDAADAARGTLVVHDALWLPPTDKDAVIPVARDVLTVHHKEYYENGGIPNDWDDPNPVPFLSVRPRCQFLFALSCADPVRLAKACAWLKEALSAWGIGGKTSSGYGRMDFPADGKLLEELAAYLRHEKKTRRASEKEILTALRTSWLEKLAMLPPALYGEVAKMIEDQINSHKRKSELAQLLADLKERLDER